MIMENLNLVELLRDCPNGMELDCAIWDNCTFEGIEDVGYINILVKTPNGLVKLSKEGYLYHNHSGSKCVIFPKGKTTWDGFQRPFKDGDIVTWEDRGSLVAFIYKERKDIALVKHHFALYTGSLGIVTDGEISLVENEIVFATEEEKQKLFDAIKENGYKWNAETKTLEKLPKFKVGDRIKEGKTIATVVRVCKDFYDIRLDSGIGSFTIDLQDNWELVPNKFDITTLEPFESRVLVRDYDNQIWIPTFWGKRLEDDSNCSYLTTNGCYRYCIPYEANKELLGTTNDCDEYYKTWEK